MKSVLIAIFWAACAFGAQLPSDLKPCKKSDPDLNKCVGEAILQFLKLVENGNSQLSFPALEPLVVPEINISLGGNNGINEQFRNFKVTGLTNSKILSTIADFDKCHIEIISVTPILKLEADYAMEGKFSTFSINGKGRYNGSLDDLKINHSVDCSKQKREGKEYIRVDKYTTDFVEVKSPYLYFENIVPGNELLSKELNSVLLENAEVFYEETKHSYEITFSQVFKSLANLVFGKIPMDQLLAA